MARICPAFYDRVLLVDGKPVRERMIRIAPWVYVSRSWLRKNRRSA